MRKKLVFEVERLDSGKFLCRCVDSGEAKVGLHEVTIGRFVKSQFDALRGEEE